MLLPCVIPVQAGLLTTPNLPYSAAVNFARTDKVSSVIKRGKDARQDGRITLLILCLLSPSRLHLCSLLSQKTIYMTEFFEYSTYVSHLGLFHLCWNDACRERDGGRTNIYMKYLLLLWKADPSNVKYAIQAWFFLALTNVLLSEAESFEMLWNRTVNRRAAGLGKGIHKDLNREFDNRPQKEQIAALSKNHDPVLAKRASKAMMGIKEVLQNFDQISGLEEKTSKHKSLSIEQDIEVLVKVFLDHKIFQELGPRHHPTFPNFSRNPYQQDASDLHSWLKKRADLTAKRGNSEFKKRTLWNLMRN
eukprot:Pompholyxophrys_punicea_v1_NODE_793_length_1283_cov_23.783388.p1 type:complete len:305 gc:universal NODE_793_length_1283_cov_23.783388:1031-117(-)